MSAKKLCVIGGGPSGMSLLYHLKKRFNMGLSVPDVTCYERTDGFGGQWNFTDKIGIDKSGDSVHSSMYKNLWINSPKEVDEYHDYPFDQHFGVETPSYFPRELMADYIKGE